MQSQAPLAMFAWSKKNSRQAMLALLLEDYFQGVGLHEISQRYDGSPR
jgi:hypothetical protein